MNAMLVEAMKEWQVELDRHARCANCRCIFEKTKSQRIKKRKDGKPSKNMCCSAECRKEFRGLRPTAKQEWICEECDSVFVGHATSKGGRKFCSIKCRELQNKIRGDRNRSINEANRAIKTAKAEIKAIELAVKKHKRQEAKENSVCYRCGERSHGKKYCNLKCAWRQAQSERRARMRGVAIESFSEMDVFKRDEFNCCYCHNKVTLPYRANVPSSATIDHLTPISKGGDHSINNAVTSCHSCNSSKGSHLLLNYLTKRN